MRSGGGFQSSGVQSASVLFISSFDPQAVGACCAAFLEFTGSSASIMGSTYMNQVGVKLSSWMTEPEVLISTKTMSSMFGKNLSSRFEVAHGDAKNLKGPSLVRHASPLL